MQRSWQFGQTQARFAKWVFFILSSALVSVVVVWRADEAIALLTMALVIVTAWYAKLNRDMVVEMRAAREAEAGARGRDRSDIAAMRCLEALQEVLDQLQRLTPAGVESETLRWVNRVLRDHGTFIADRVVRDRVSACAEVAFVASFDTEQMQRERLSSGTVRVNFRGIAGATRRVLERHLRGEPPHPWEWHAGTTNGQASEFPGPGEAGGWIRTQSRAGDG